MGRPGATFWTAFPDQGRYILSLTPHDGFIKAGAIRDNVISYQDAGQAYEAPFMSPIAGAAPNQTQRNSVAMGTDRLDNLLSK
jgi:hypothetical protein